MLGTYDQQHPLRVCAPIQPYSRSTTGSPPQRMMQQPQLQQHRAYATDGSQAAERLCVQPCNSPFWPLAQQQQQQQQQQCSGAQAAVTPGPTAPSPGFRPQQVLECILRRRQQQQTAAAATAAGGPPPPVHSPAGPSSLPCSTQQQQQLSPGSSLTSSATMQPQCSALPPQSSTMLSASSTNGDLFSSIVTSLEEEVTKAIRPIVSQVIQQRLLQEVQTQMARISGDSLQQQVVQQVQQQVQQLVGLQQQQHQTAAGSSPVRCSLTTSESSDPSTISSLAAGLYATQQQHQQQRSLHLASCPSSSSRDSAVLPAATPPSAAAAGTGLTCRTSNLTISLTALAPLAVDTTGLSAGSSTPATMLSSSSSSRALPFSPFARQPCQQAICQALVEQQQQGVVVFSHMPPPQPVVPAAAAAAADTVQGYCCHNQQQQQHVASTAMTPDSGHQVAHCPAATAAATDDAAAASIWQCGVSEEAMRELLNDTELPGPGLVGTFGATFGGTMSHQGPITGTIFDDIDGLGDFFAEDDLNDLDLALPAAAAGCGGCIVIQHQQQHQHQQQSVRPSGRPASPAVAASDDVEHSSTAAHTSRLSTAFRTQEVMRRNSSSGSGTAKGQAPAGTAAVGLSKKRSREEFHSAKLNTSFARKRSSSKSSSQCSGVSDSCSAQQWRKQQRTQQQRQQQQQQQCPPSNLLSQLPSWLTKHMM